MNGAQLLTIEPRLEGHWYNLVGEFPGQCISMHNMGCRGLTSLPSSWGTYGEYGPMVKGWNAFGASESWAFTLPARMRERGS